MYSLIFILLWVPGIDSFVISFFERTKATWLLFWRLYLFIFCKHYRLCNTFPPRGVRKEFKYSFIWWYFIIFSVVNASRFKLHENLNTRLVSNLWPLQSLACSFYKHVGFLASLFSWNNPNVSVCNRPDQIVLESG